MMVERSQLQYDMPIHKLIPMEKLDLIHPNEVRILYYKSPSQFYVYLRQKINSHAQFQVELQRAMENYQSNATSPQYHRYQSVAAQDNHAIWHRAMILDTNCDSTDNICVYFVDVGQEENISITNIRPLPSEFNRQPAFAIPCRLYGIQPLNSSEPWKLDDPVHDEFNRLMGNIALCKVCNIKEQMCYDVSIDIPQVGDLGTYLVEQKLVSLINMRTASNQTLGRIPPGFADIQQPLQTRVIQKPVVQQSPNTPTSTESTSDISTLPPQDGYYIITQVYSAIEFYGHSQIREKELEAFHKHLEMIYNNNANDQSLSVHFLMEGVACVIQQGDKYHRVVIKHRESESRVLAKLVDRGDEILVDTSELLQLEKKYSTIPAFAQPFRLYGYDESHSTSNVTRKLKRWILNQRVHITQHLPIINGFYQVEVKLSDSQSVNQILLSNDANPVIPPPIRPVEVPSLQPPRTNEDLPAPPKLLTAPPQATTRFTAAEQASRFSRSQQQQEEEVKPAANGYQSLVPEHNRANSRGFSVERNGNNNLGGRSNEENGGPRSGRFGGNRGGFADRGGRNGFGGDRNNNNDEDVGQRTGGFGSNRGGGNFADRGGRNGFGSGGGDRNYNDEDNGQRTGGFGSNRGGGGFADRGGRNGFDSDRNNNNENGGQRTGGFGGNRGARNGNFQDRNNRFRNSQDDGNNENNGVQRFASRGGFNGERRDRNGAGNFQNNYDREAGENNPRRGGFGDRGGPRGGRGGFGDRGNRGGGGRGGFGDRGQRGGGGFRDNVRSNDDTNEPLKTFSGWPNIKPTPVRFEAGDQFVENERPSNDFQFVLSHIEKNNDFFIQLCSKGNELSDLTETLQKEYKDAPELSFSSIKINQPCLAKSSDNCWYRAVILTTGITNLKVRFIDFGDTIDLDTKTIRQLAKKFCSTPPYAYHCTIKNVQSNENVKTNEIIDKCAGREFHGKIENKASDGKYFLQSDDFEQLMLDIKAIEKHRPCVIVYIDSDKHQFYIQDDSETMEKIETEITTDIELPPEDIQVNSMVISTFEEAPYRAIIQSDLDDNVSVYFIDYGNTNICPKDSLKKCPDELKAYPPQAKRCQLSDVYLDQAFKQLDEYLESDQVAHSIVNQTDDFYNVLLYVNGECFNEKFSNETSIDLDDQSSTTTATTVKEQERPVSASGKRNNEAILSPTGNSLSTPANIKRKKSESEAEGNFNKYRQGTLTFIDKTKPLVYLQLIPESESILEQIADIIDALVQENQHNSTYEIGDYVIAQFTDDNQHYRARIEAYSSSTELYTVYFLDYGNTDENVSKDHLYSYSDQLKDIPPQVQGYSLDKITSQTWINIVLPLLEEKQNETIDFYFLDDTKSTIHIKFDNENQIYHQEQEQQQQQQPKTFTGNISGTNQDCFYIHILPDADTLICEMDELLQAHPKEHSNEWKINDLCIVFSSEEDQYFRGKILNENYDIQCIDYGYILTNITDDNLYLLTNQELIKQKPIARQCRLHGVDENDHIKVINEIIRDIPSNERVTITVDNDQTDQCMPVMLFRENNEIVNDRFAKQSTNLKESLSTSSSDSAIGDTVTSPFGMPQAESTHQFVDTTNLTTNQTIDFGENDASNTTIRDEN